MRRTAIPAADAPRLRHAAAVAVVFALACMFLWLPFGFRLSGVLEEWNVLSMFTTDGPFFVVTADTPFAIQHLRPLTVFPHAIAYWLDPNSFDWWHVLLVLAIFFKGIGASLLGRAATGSRRWGMAYGLLVVFYPADTMQLSFRSLHINWSLALVLLGSAWVLKAWEAQERSRRVWLSAGAFALLIVSILMYEVALPLLATPFLVGFARSGLRRTLGRIRTAPLPVVACAAAALAYAIYVAWVPPVAQESYQSSLVAGHSVPRAILASLAKLFDPGLVRSLLGGWVDAWGILRSEFAGYGYVLVAAVALTACVLMTANGKRGDDAEPASEPSGTTRSLLRMAAAGLVLLVLGFAPYMVSPPHLAITQRTYLFASPGAALVILSVLMAIARLGRPPAFASLFLLLTLGVAAQLFQFRHYVAIADRQRQILRTIIENFDGDTKGKTLLVKDASGQLGHLWMLRDHLKLALTYFYGKPITDVEICLTQQMDWQHLDDLARTGRCTEHSDHWALTGPRPIAGVAPIEGRIVSKANAVVLEIGPDGSMTPDPRLANYRQELASGKDNLAIRYRRILARDFSGFSQQLFGPEGPGERYRWSFGKWWNLDVPTRGGGWREAEWTGSFLHRHPSAWKTEGTATLLFDLRPVQRPYVLDGKFDVILNEVIKNTVSLKVNGHPVEIQWPGADRFRSAVPAEYLDTGVNVLEFDSAIDTNYYDLSVKLAWVELRPQ